MVASNEAYHHSSLHSLLLFFRGEGGYGYKNEVRRTKSYGDMSESVGRREKGCECESFEDVEYDFVIKSLGQVILCNEW